VACWPIVESICSTIGTRATEDADRSKIGQRRLSAV
jgi:hypothetical protein